MSYQSLTWDFLKSKNLPDKSIAAVMGNIQQESAFDPEIIEQGNGIGFGLCQWSYSRRTQLEAYGTDFTHQLNFLWSELSGENLEETGADFQWINQSGYLQFNDFMAGNGTIEDLTSAFCFSWERPDPQYANLTNRQEWANTYFTQFNGTGGGGGNVKLIFPFWFSRMNRISFKTNSFELISTSGNIAVIKNTLSNRKYVVNKTSIKSI